MYKKLMGILFDKDGTLFDFQSTWSPCAAKLIEELTEQDDPKRLMLVKALGFDHINKRFFKNSVMIAGSADDVVSVVLTVLPHRAREEVMRHLVTSAEQLTQYPILPLKPFFSSLVARNLRIGVATNDSIEAARGHLMQEKIIDTIHYLAGYDSGFGAKPDPGMCLEFLRCFDLEPSEAVMVGDSLHDLHAGRAAGMRTVGVLTGVAERSDLAPHADVVLRDIGEIPAWIDAHNT